MRGKEQHPAVLLFLKAPVPGRVKTRLAREIGDEAACEVYCQMVEQQIAVLPGEWPVEIHFDPESARQDFAAWLGPSCNYHPQPEGDLGRRLRTAVAAAFARGRERILLIGGDCPSLDAATLNKGARFLSDGADVVIGPATDGGYYLLGLRRLANADVLFEEIPWSSRDVARVTTERADALRLQLARLDEKEDVDDLAAYRRAIAAGHLGELRPDDNPPRQKRNGPDAARNDAGRFRFLLPSEMTQPGG